VLLIFSDCGADFKRKKKKKSNISVGREGEKPTPSTCH